MPFYARPWVLVLAAVLLLVATLVNLYVSARAVENLRSDFARLEVSYDVLQTRQRLLSAMLGAETGQRDFILTGQEPLLEPYYDAAQRVDSLAARLETLAAVTPRKQPLLPVMHAHVASKRREMAGVLALYDEQGPEAARAAVGAGSGRAEMDALRSVLHAMEQQALAKMDERRARAESSRRRALLSIGLANALLLLLLGSTALIARGSLRTRERVTRDLRCTNDALSEALAEREAALARVRAMQEQLVQQEKLASLGRLTAGVAHELMNPLNFITNFAQLAEEMASEARDALAAGHVTEAGELLADVATNAGRICTHGRRADGVVRSMLVHARGMSGERVSVDLHALLDEATEQALGPSGHRDLRLERDYAPALDGLVLRGVPSALSRLVINLVENAVQAVQQRAETAGPDYVPTVLLRTRPRRAPGGDELAGIVVEDNGTGIPPDILPRVFDSFFTTRPPGKGTGLGLSLAHDIAVGHGGRLVASAAPDGGACFTLTLPVAPRRAPETEAPRSAPSAPAPSSADEARAAGFAQPATNTRKGRAWRDGSHRVADPQQQSLPSPALRPRPEHQRCASPDRARLAASMRHMATPMRRTNIFMCHARV
ncbi:MAG: CHASE3 domain-containing protein [Rubricoccaceae bacterium]